MLANVWADGGQQEGLNLDEVTDDAPVHLLLAHLTVPVPGNLHLEPARLQRLLEVHRVVVLPRLHYSLADLAHEHAVVVGRLGVVDHIRLCLINKFTKMIF